MLKRETETSQRAGTNCRRLEIMGELTPSLNKKPSRYPVAPFPFSPLLSPNSVFPLPISLVCVPCLAMFRRVVTVICSDVSCGYEAWPGDIIARLGLNQPRALRRLQSSERPDLGRQRKPCVMFASVLFRFPVLYLLPFLAFRAGQYLRS